MTVGAPSKQTSFDGRSTLSAFAESFELRSVLAQTVVTATQLTHARSGVVRLVDADQDMVDVATAGEARGGRADEDSLERPILARGELVGSLCVTGRRDRESFAGADIALIQALAAAAGSAIDNTHAVIASERRRQWLEATAELTDALQPPLDLQRAFADIAHVAREILNASAIAVVTCPDGDEPALAATAGSPPEELEPWLPEIATAIQLTDQEALVDLSLGEYAAVVVCMHAQLISPSLLVALFDPDHSPHDPVERHALAAFADQAALALERGQGVADHERTLLVAERERIARDLHDHVIQRLFAIGLLLETARTAPGSDAADILEGCTSEIDAVIKEIRTTIFSLDAPERIRDEAPRPGLSSIRGGTD